MLRNFALNNGSRLLDVTTDRLWLVLHGRRHHISCVDVHKSLFKESVEVHRVSSAQLADVKQGEDLMFGTCLARADNSITAYLLAVHPTKVRAHAIPSTLVLERYGFDLSLCRQVRYLSGITEGKPLEYSAEQPRRKGLRAYLAPGRRPAILA